MPTLIGLMVAVGVLRASGFLQAVGGLFGGLAGEVGFSSGVVSLGFVEMVLSSGGSGVGLGFF